MDQVEEIKTKVDIVELVGEYVPLKKAGRNYKGLCPFHGEKTPSFMVNAELQIFKCFGCGAGGDCYSFLQRMEGMEFGEALRTLAGRVGVTLTSYLPTQGEQLRERLIRLNTLAADYYHFLLAEHQLGRPALGYAKERGLTEEAIKRFKLGYAPPGWDYLSKYLSAKKKFSVAEMEQAGLVVAGRNYDRFRHRLMFPLNDRRGQTVGFAGRVLPGAKEEEGGKYINTPETEVYHKSELLYAYDVTRADIKTANQAVVVEGEIDAIASWQAGVKNVVAIKGSALTDRQVELLRRLSDTVLLALDADLAGDAAARRGIEIAQKAGLFVRTVDWPRGQKQAKDVADIAMGEAQKWQAMVAGGGISVYDFYIDSAGQKYGLSAEGKVRVAREVVPVLATIADPILLAQYIQHLAEKLSVREDDIRLRMEKLVPGRGPQASSAAAPPAKRSRREILEEYLVALALRSADQDKVATLAASKLLRTNFWQKVAAQLVRVGMVKKLPAELRAKVEELVLAEGDYSDKEWLAATQELEEIGVREEITLLRGDDRPQAQKALVRLTRRLGELTADR